MGRAKKKHYPDCPRNYLQVVSPIVISLDKTDGCAGVLI